jgi:hypothetical protein
MLASLQVASLALTCAVWVTIPAIFVASRFSRSGRLRRSVPASFWAALQTILTGAVAGQDGQLQHWSAAGKLACDKAAIVLAAAGLAIMIAALIRQPARSAHRRVRHHSAP